MDYFSCSIKFRMSNLKWFEQKYRSCLTYDAVYINNYIHMLTGQCFLLSVSIISFE